MSILNSLKDYLGGIMLRREMKTHSQIRKINKFKFENVKTIGIIFDAANADDFELVKRYVTELREAGKKVKVLGFFKTNGVPSLTYSKLDFDFFSNKEVSFFGKPTAVIIQNFIDEAFDLLIDLNIHDHFALRYVAAMSKAVFKVGKFEGENDIHTHDMMIDADHTQTIKYFLRQIDTYITMLNKAEPSLN